MVELSGCYPYFIQFFAWEAYDLREQRRIQGREGDLPIDEIPRKLDEHFFRGRWSRLTDRQRELLTAAAHIDGTDGEFSLGDLVERSKMLDNGFSHSNANQILRTLIKAGLLYKHRHGRYRFALPLMDKFIRRATVEDRRGDDYGHQRNR